jgi:hypothetical protein
MILNIIKPINQGLLRGRAFPHAKNMDSIKIENGRFGKEVKAKKAFTTGQLIFSEKAKYAVPGRYERLTSCGHCFIPIDFYNAQIRCINCNLIYCDMKR